MSDLFSSSTPCRCPSCSNDPLPTYTEKFRAECEIRSLAAMPSHTERGAYLALVEKARGRNAAERIRQTLWKTMREIA